MINVSNIKDMNGYDTSCWAACRTFYKAGSLKVSWPIDSLLEVFWHLHLRKSGRTWLDRSEPILSCVKQRFWMAEDSEKYKKRRHSYCVTHIMCITIIWFCLILHNYSGCTCFLPSSAVISKPLCRPGFDAEVTCWCRIDIIRSWSDGANSFTAAVFHCRLSKTAEQWGGKDTLTWQLLIEEP